MKIIKSLTYLIVLGFISIVLIGCSKAEIKLAFEEESYTVKVGEQLTLDWTIENEDNIPYKIVYTVTDDDFATFSNDVVTGKAVGTVTVRISLEGDEDVFAEAELNVVLPTKYTVTFNTGGGSEVAVSNVFEKNKVNEPDDPTKVGHTFGGWYSNEATTIPYNFNAPVNSNIVLFAKWEVIKYTVIFDTDGGTSIEPILVNHGSKVLRPEDPKKENYVFLGWIISNPGEDDVMIDFDFNTLITKDLTVYANWELNSYDVVFNSSGGSTISGVEVSHGEKLTKPTNPTRDGFEFVGWFKDNAKTISFNFENDVITEATVLYGKWKLNQLDGMLNARGGTISTIVPVFGPKEGAVPVTQELGYFNDGYSGVNAETSIWIYEGDHYLFNGNAQDNEKAWWGFQL